MQTYIILSSANRIGLIEQVNEKIAEGYNLYETIVINPDADQAYMQAMIKTTEPKQLESKKLKYKLNEEYLSKVCSNRLYNAIRNIEVVGILITIQDLVDYSLYENDYSKILGFGQKTLKELRQLLEKYDIVLLKR